MNRISRMKTNSPGKTMNGISRMKTIGADDISIWEEYIKGEKPAQFQMTTYSSRGESKCLDLRERVRNSLTEAKQRISELRDTESEEDALNRKEIEAFNVNATLFAFSKVIVMLP